MNKTSERSKINFLFHLPEALWARIEDVSKAFGETPDSLISRLVNEGLIGEEKKIDVIEHLREKPFHSI